MYNFKNKELTKKDLYVYREKYIKFNIYFHLFIIILTLFLFGFLTLFGEFKYNRFFSTMILVFIEIIIIYGITKNIFINLKELKKTNISFSVKSGVFKYVVRGTIKYHSVYCYVDGFKIYTQFTTSKLRRYNGKNVDVYFYINDKNIKEAFLINQLD